MFDSVEELSGKLAASGYFIDPVMTMDIFLAGKLRKPVILEGPAGSGKTQLALAVAKAANTHIERLQCYEGLTDKQAIGEFNEGLQKLYMEFCRGEGLTWQEIVQNLKGRDFFRPGPIMRALESERSCVHLIDEIDKVDKAKEALLLEPLSDYQLPIPNSAPSKPEAFPS
jgi:MoxR-like ATPase